MTITPIIFASHYVKRFLFATLIFLALVPVSEGRTVAFLFALDADWKAFQEAALAKPRAREMGGRTIFEVKVGDATVYATKMEAGCVQTAISAQALLANRKVDLAVSVGPVGSLDDDLAVGSWAVVNAVVPWQKTEFAKISADSVPKIAFPALEPLPASLAERMPVSVASGEQFIASASQRAELALATGCQAVDMNLFGLVSVLDLHAVPSVHLRVASDKADESAGEDFMSFVEAYTGEGGRMAAEIIAGLPPDMTSPTQYPALEKLLDGAAGEGE
jgi:adenosylhomocysteine nucleosidase